MGHDIFAEATFAQNSCGREAESGPCLFPLVQSQMGETNPNSNMTSCGTVRQNAAPSAGTPSEP